MKRNRSVFIGGTIVLLIAASVASWAASTIRLRARANALINGITAQLRGDFRSSGTPIRLNSELEMVNLPVGTRVAFCLVQGGAPTQLGTGRVLVLAGVRTAFVELTANDGDFVPATFAGDKLQARQRKTAPFLSAPNCSSPLLVSATFQ